MNKLLMSKKVINIIDETKDLNYKLEDNEEVIINFFTSNASSMNIETIQNNNSKLVINYACLNNNDINININSLIEGNNNEIVIKFRTIAESKHASINVCTRVNEKTKNNNVIEDLKAIVEEGTATLMPILEIETNEVMASHYATVSSYDKDELFYLEAKGLSEKASKMLIRKSFLYGLFSDNFKDMIDKGEIEDES